MILKRNYIPAFPDENTEQLIKAFYQNSTFSVLINKRISMRDLPSNAKLYLETH